MSFSQALSGLNAASKSLDAIGNNIANSQTVGFKSSGVQFADVYAGTQIGQGVRVAGVLQNMGNGTLDTTGRNLDLGINGGGFFRFDQGGQAVYSRNGQLTMTPDGFLENANGAKLTGFVGGTGTGGTPQPIAIPTEGMGANATTKTTETLNLNAGSPVIAAALDPSDPATYSYANTGTVYDSLGVQHIMTSYFTKTADNAWNVDAYVDGTAAGNGTLAFDANGALTGSTPINVAFAPTGGAAPMAYTLGFAGSTQFGADFALNALTQDGYTSGSLVGIHFNTDGSVVGNYSNDQTRTLGTIALANFRNPEGLQPLSDNVWAETSSSGQPLLGTAGAGQLGSIQGGTLEQSNVDLATELVNLIIAQRNYQANTQTIKTQDQVLQTVVNGL
ncbi:MAG TPA: flagellar hook protein FlgE [Rhodanobacteraceae bacterium]|nr:flagellar hook protein FlgE [Rhodanobacteraceae bacterium]